jgi:2-phosphosulfolactate phosphatase
MEIRILEMIEGAKQAQGLAVIIDVFRAFTTECYVINNRAEKIIPVGDIQVAYRLKQEHPEYILMGERKGQIQPGFDYGNSPTQIEHIDFSGKTAVHTTSAGTQGIVNAQQASEIITGSFVNAAAIVRYIRSRKPDIVSLVAMGIAGKTTSSEDMMAAEYIRDLLNGIPVNDEAVRQQVLKGDDVQKFLDPDIEWAPERDVELCTAFNRFDFVLRVQRGDEFAVITRFDI